jgi:hypothetical protein
VARKSPSWLDTLASQISEKTGERVTADLLARQFHTFREDCRDPLLRQSYPPDMHHFKRSNRPQASTRDIILSFMDKNYPNVHEAPIIAEIAARLDQEVDKGRSSSELEKVLIKERIPRYAQGPKRGHTYWGLNRRSLQDKYAGFYVLLRISSGNHLQAEAFAIAIKSHDPTRVSVYWMCDKHGRVGDLIVNTYRFSGLTVRKSTDAVIEPVSVSLLRAPRKRRDGQVLPLVLGGFIVGWKDSDFTALFHSRVALIKLDLGKTTIGSYSDFESIIKPAQVSAAINRVLELPAVHQLLVPKFLEGLDLAITQSEASDALPDLDPSFLSLQL